MDKVDKQIMTTVLAATAMHGILNGSIEQNREVVSEAEKQGIDTAEATAIVAFDFAEAMMAEAQKRGHV